MIRYGTVRKTRALGGHAGKAEGRRRAMRWAGSSRRRLTAVRRTKRSDVDVAEGSSAAEDDRCAGESELDFRELHENISLEDIVPSLWLPSYVELFCAELEHNRRLAGRVGSALAPSSYRARLTGTRGEAYDAKMLRRERDQLAIELHANNMRCWSPSLVARSIAYFHLTSVWQRSVETGQRRLASQPSTLKALRLMRDCRPPTAWERGRHVFAYAFDQTYEWVGMQKHGRRQAVETVDALGMPMAITHEVYINSIQMHLPASLGTLSPADIAAIQANHGSAYTEDYNDLLNFLRVSLALPEPSKVNP